MVFARCEPPAPAKDFLVPTLGGWVGRSYTLGPGQVIAGTMVSARCEPGARLYVERNSGHGPEMDRGARGSGCTSCSVDSTRPLTCPRTLRRNVLPSPPSHRTPLPLPHVRPRCVGERRRLIIPSGCNDFGIILALSSSLASTNAVSTVPVSHGLHHAARHFVLINVLSALL